MLEKEEHQHRWLITDDKKPVIKRCKHIWQRFRHRNGAYIFGEASFQGRETAKIDDKNPITCIYQL